MKMPIRAAAVLALALPALLAAGSAHAQGSYPSKPIRLIVPYVAGGGTDVFARTISTRMSQELGQQLVVENHPGAGTIIGAQIVATAQPDGYTVLLGDSGTYAINPSLYKKLPYDPTKDFAPVGLTARFPLALVVHPSVPAKTVQEFIALAKAAPGKYDFGSPGAGSPHHLAMEQFRQRAGLQMTHVPYKGAAAALQDLLAGRVPVMFIDLTTIQAYLGTDKLRVLAVTSAERLPLLPDVPTVSEAALPGYEASAWQGLAVPRGTPQAVIDRLNQAYARTVADPAVKKRLTELNAETIPGTPAQMSSYMKEEAAKWAGIVKEAHVTLD